MFCLPDHTKKPVSASKAFVSRYMICRSLSSSASVHPQYIPESLFPTPSNHLTQYNISDQDNDTVSVPCVKGIDNHRAVLAVQSKR